MSTIFMNPENLRRLDLRRVQKSIALSNLSIYYT